MSGNYLCDAWLVEDVLDSPSSGSSVFLIDIHANIVPNDSMREIISASDRIITVKQFEVTRDVLLQNTSSWCTISNMLTQMDLPFYVYSIMIQRIMQCAQESLFMESKIIPMVVHLRPAAARSTSPSRHEELMMESLDAQGSKLVPASGSAIERLEKVQISEFSRQCVICLDEIPVGNMETRLPCLHVYHGCCIQNWLKNSNVCPLCRFRIDS